MTVAATQPEKVEPEVGQLPVGWVWTDFHSLVQFISDKADPKTMVCRYIGLEHIGKGTGRILGEGISSEVTSTKTLFQPGDVLYGKLRPYLNKVALAALLGICSTDILALRPLPSLQAEFLLYRLLARDFVEYASMRVSGVQHPRTDSQAVGQFSVALPPLAEQRRIVAKIEELFSKLDAGVLELKRTRALLKRYRQSVLHAAVTGELSRDWREAQGDELEDARHLLAHLLDERRTRWATSGKKGKYAEPKGPDVAGLPELPKGWVWVSLEQILRQPLRNGHSAKESPNGSGIRTLTLTAVTLGDFSEHNTKITVADARKVADMWLTHGDFLIERGNTPELVGTTRLYKGPDNFSIFPDLIIRARILELVHESYMEHFFLSKLARNHLTGRAQGSAGTMPKVDQNDVEELPVPIPALAEQVVIAMEVERRLSILSNVEATVEAELKRAESTRQGILRRAFAGQLVPQDAGDEPASVLLERIQAERLAAGAAAVRATGKRGRKPKTATQVALLGPGDA